MQSKFANLQLPHLYLSYRTSIWSLIIYAMLSDVNPHYTCTCLAHPLGVAPFEIRCFRQEKLESMRYVVALFFVILRLAVSVEHRLVTDRQTDRHTTAANTRAS